MASRLKLELLGGCRLTLDGKALELRFAKSRALLCYLAVNCGPHSREVLTDLLWSEYPDEDARTSLRARLSGLRRTLPDHLVISRDSVAFNHESPYELDVEQFLRALETPGDLMNLRKAVERYRGDFLEGFHVAKTLSFEAWLTGEREKLREVASEALQRLATHGADRGDYKTAQKDLTQLLSLDPWREEVHRQLMRVYALNGQREAAIAQYLTCCRLLADELGLEPARETTRLYEEIRAGDVGAHPITVSLAPLQLIAERRQLTVMSCELLGVGAFSDPEELHEHISTYHRMVSEAVARFEGFVAQRQGPSVTAYFGFPSAHEDDAQRALHSSLKLIEALRTSPIALKVRVGVHTGVVVITHEQAGAPEVIGLAPVAAQRLQSASEAGWILISGATERLVRGYFALQDLGSRLLEGLAEPLEVCRVLKETPARSRLQAIPPKTVMVGRDNELSELLQTWEKTRSHQGQGVFVGGEAGIGKSRLLYAFKERLAGTSYHWLEGHCFAYHMSSPFYPVIDLIEQELGFDLNDTPEAKLDKLEAALVVFDSPPKETLPLLATLLSLPYAHRYPPLSLSPERQRQRTLEALAQGLTLRAARATQVPVVFVMEDLHWCDPSTLELFGQLVEKMDMAPFLLLLTARPEFDLGWAKTPRFKQILLDNLSQESTTALIDQLTTGTSLPSGALEQLTVKSDGVPLYIEELTKGVLESGWLATTRHDGTSNVPSSLQDALTARLDRLGEAKGVAQLASVIGRNFTLDLLAATSTVPEPTLNRSLGQLVEAELVYRDADRQRYSFRHALIQDAAYTSLLKRQRRDHHARVAKALSEGVSHLPERQPELLAQHYAAAGLFGKAIQHWQEAAESALARSAYQEAVQHLNAALEALAGLPETSARQELELTLLLGLGGAFHGVKGYAAAEVEAVYRQARALCQTLNASPQLFDALLGLAVYYCMRAQYPAAEELVQQMFRLPQHLLTPVHLGELHFIASRVNGFQGRLVASSSHIESVLSLSDVLAPQSAVLTGIPSSQGIQGVKAAALGYASLILWLRGYPDQALVNLRKYLAYANKGANLHLQASALIYGIIVCFVRGERREAQKHLEAFMTLATEHILTSWLAYGQAWQGAFQVAAGKAEGLVLIRNGLDLFDTQGTVTPRPFLLGIYASAQHRAGQFEPALRTFGEAIAQVDKTGERWWEAELHRLKGELLLAMDRWEGAEVHFRKAIAVAKDQQAKSLELRAAVSLVQLMRKQGEGSKARSMLAEVYSWFTEGLDTRDLREAGALLKTLQTPVKD